MSDLQRILIDGCPAKFNAEGTNQDFLEQIAYGNHLSISKNIEKVMRTMNKEDQKDHVLTSPAWLAQFIPHLMLFLNDLTIKFGKMTVSSSMLLTCYTRTPPPSICTSTCPMSPILFFGKAWLKFLTIIYNFQIWKFICWIMMLSLPSINSSITQMCSGKRLYH